MKSKCFILSGVKGCGKSSYAQTFKNQLLLNKESVEIISLEKIQAQFTGDFSKIQNLFFDQIKEASFWSKNVIVDFSCITNEERIFYAQQLTGYFKGGMHLVLFNIPLKTCKTRSSDIEKTKSEWKKFESVDNSVKKLYKTIKRVKE